MLNNEDSAEYWADEIRAADAHAKKHHIPIARMVEQYGTRWFRDDLTTEPTPENHVFAWIAWMLPQLAYSAPSPNVVANWQKSHGPIAEWMQACGRRWGSTSPLAQEFNLFVRDALFAFGVMKRGIERVDGKIRPYLQHIPMDAWLCDPRKNDHLDRALFQAHKYAVYLDEIQAMRGVDPAALEKVKSTYEPAGETGGIGVKGGQTGERKMAWVYDIWMRRSRRVGTLLATGPNDPAGVWLRPPRDWWGPRRGPFVVLGFKNVPGSPVPCSDLQPVMQQIQAMNAHLRAEAAEASTFKTGVGVDASMPDAAAAIEQGENGGIWMIPGLASRRNAVVPITIGGVHPERLEHTERMLDRIKRQLAMGDAQQGISNSDTATANQIADQASNIRVKGMRTTVNAVAAEAMQGVMWYHFYDSEVEERVTITQPQTDPITGETIGTREVEGYIAGGTDGGWYRGEFFPPMADVSWEEDFTVTIDPDSTSPTNDVQQLQNAMLLLDIQARAYTALATMPGADVEAVVNRIGETMNIRNLFDLLFTEQVVAMAQAGNPMPPLTLPQGASPAMAPGVQAHAGVGRQVGMARPGMGGGFARPPVQAGGAAPRRAGRAQASSPYGGGGHQHPDHPAGRPATAGAAG